MNSAKTSDGSALRRELRSPTLLSLVLLLLAGASLYAAGSWLLLRDPLRIQPLAVPAVGASLALSLERLKRPTAASWTLIVSAWLPLVWGMATVPQSEFTATTIALIIPIVVAGLLLGLRAATLTAVASAVAGFLIGVTDLVPNSPGVYQEATAASIWLGQVATFATAVGLVYLAVSGLRSTVSALEISEAELDERNRELRAQVRQREEAEAQLRLSEEHHRQISEMASDLSYKYVLRDGSTLSQEWMFGACEEITGYTPEELNADQWTHLIVPGDEEEFAERTRQMLADGGGAAEFRIRTKRGDIRWVSQRVRIVPGPDKLFIFAATQDITKRKLAERELAQYQIGLEELVEERSSKLAQSERRLIDSERLASVGTLAAGVAHQINNPIGSILASSEYALMCEDDDCERDIWRSALLSAAEQARRCGDIVRSVLRFSAGERAEKWPTNLADVIHRVYRLTEVYAKENSASLTLDLGEAELIVLMSPIEIEQVLLNVIRNAIESRDDGAQVNVQARRGIQTVTVTVSDNGRGIEPARLKHVFDPFHTTRGTSGGSGLGLSVAHGIVIDHAGEIRIRSEGEGRGTSVSLELPLHDKA